MKKRPNVEKYQKFAIKIMEDTMPSYCEFVVFDGKKNKAIKTMFYIIFNPLLFVKLTPFHQEELLKYTRDKFTNVFTKRRNNPEMGYELCPKCKGYRVVIQFRRWRFVSLPYKYNYVEDEIDRKKFERQKLFTGYNIDNCDFCDMKGQVDYIQYLTKTKKDSKGRIINIQLKGVNENIRDDEPFF